MTWLVDFAGPGKREAAAAEAFATGMGYYDKQLKAGKLTSVTHCLEGVGVIPAYTGAAIGDLMQRWVKSVPR